MHDTYNCWRGNMNTPDGSWPHVIREVTKYDSIGQCGCKIFWKCHF